MNDTEFINFLTAEVLIWVIPCVIVCVGIGVILGRGFTLRNLSSRMRKDRKQLVDALQALLQSTEKLTCDVGTHNSELETMGESVNDISAGGDLEVVQEALLSQITIMVASNRRMEDDLVMTHYRLEEQAQELDRTRIEARTDQLSGLSNRKAFDEFLKFVISQHNLKGTPFALLLADVDHFKRINDTHGHHSGDRVVHCLGDTLLQLTREQDHVARIGGDEFAVVLVGVDATNSRRAGARIRAAVERSNFDVGEDGACIAVTLSMGMAFPERNDTTEALFQRADKALYRSKEGGRNQLHVWAPSPVEIDVSEDEEASEHAEVSEASDSDERDVAPV